MENSGEKKRNLIIRRKEMEVPYAFHCQIFPYLSTQIRARRNSNIYEDDIKSVGKMQVLFVITTLFFFFKAREKESVGGGWRKKP